MKKIILAILTILLIVLTYIILAKSISIAGFKVESISDIKTASTNLEKDTNRANSLVDETYPNEITSLEEAIKNLKIAKQKFESKSIYNANQTDIGTVHIDTYKIHFLWTKLGNYRKDRGIKSLNLDLKSTQTADVYDLEFTLIGTYSNIIEFLYDIEEDEELDFEPKDFEISSNLNTKTETEKPKNSTNTNNTNNNTNNLGNTNTSNNTNNANNSTTVKGDGINLKATFTVEF